MKLNIRFFNELTLEQLYEILKLRFDAFVIEQKSIYDEFDRRDYEAIHIFFQDKNEIMAYLRIYKKSDKIASIGRLVVVAKLRKQGLGKKIVKAGIDCIKDKWNADKIEIGAQAYLKKFYGDFGFIQTSDVYDDCGVPHISMELKL